MTPDERRQLLAVAREAIQTHLGLSVPKPRADPPSGVLGDAAAAFVTLYTRSSAGAWALRGCIGTLERTGPLIDTVRSMAVAAATRDPRFTPLRPSEVPDLRLAISVLSPLRPAKPEEIEVGRHGLQITRGSSRGILLPQVATENGWDRWRFLAETCRKAGLEEDAWRDPAARIEIFEAEVFGEE